MDATDIWTNIGIAVFGFGAALYAYVSKRPQQQPQSNRYAEAIVTGVGMEIGNRDQTERLIAELKRMADSLAVLADRKQALMEDKLDELLERMEEKERN